MSTQLRKKVEQLSAVENPQRVKVLILGEQRSMYSDFYFLAKFSNLIKLDLSYNKISTFPIGFNFKNLGHLRILLLHYNKLGNFKSLHPVTQSTSIQYLTLFGNPLQQAKTRHFMVNQISSLKMMDEKIVGMDERYSQIQSQYFLQPIKVNFPIVTVLETESSEGFLAGVVQQLFIIRQKYLQANPIIKIQRWFRKCLKNYRKKIQQEQQVIHLMTDIEYKKQREDERNRLMTQKLQISRSNEEKIISVFKMNFEFYSVLKARAREPVYASRAFCEQNNIKFEGIENEYYCLRSWRGQNLENKSFFALIIKISQNFLVRKKGHEPLNRIRNQYQLYEKFLKKNKSKYIQFQQNAALLQKMSTLSKQYNESLVKITQTEEVKFHLLKQSYLKLKAEGATQSTVSKYFPFCLGQILDRTAASVSIQRAWRGYRDRKNRNSFKELLKQFSARKIQKWVKSMAFIHRSVFLMNIRSYLKRSTSKSLTIQINEILQLQQKHDQNQKAINLVLPDQKFRFQVQRGKKFIVEMSQNNGERMILPEYLQQLLEYEHLQDTEQDKAEHQNIFKILLQKVISTKYWTRNDKKYLTVTYQTLKQAQTRKFILALVSYTFADKYFIKDAELTVSKNYSSMEQNIGSQYFFVSDPNEEKDFLAVQRNYIPTKIKLFVGQNDFTQNIYVFLPIGQQKQQILSRKQSIQIQNESIANYKSLAASSDNLQSEVDQSNNYRVGLKLYSGRIHNKIMYFGDRSEQGSITNEDLTNQLSQIKKEKQVNPLHQQSFANKITQIAREDDYHEIQSIDTHQNVDTIVNTNSNIKEKIKQKLRDSSLQSLQEQENYLSANLNNYHLQKSKSLNPKKYVKDISIDIPGSNKNDQVNSFRRDFNTELGSLQTRWPIPKTYRYHNFHENTQTQLSYNKNLQSVNTFNQLLKIQRTQKIKELKESHKKKLKQNSEKKQKFLDKIKQEMREDSLKNKTTISNNKLLLENSKIERHNRIKAFFQKTKDDGRYGQSILDDSDKKSIKSIIAKTPRSQFETEFVTKGNKSMKLQMLKFQKAREYQLLALHNTKNILKSSRHMISEESASPTSQDFIKSKQLRQKNKGKQLEVFKTEIKQFSMQLDEPYMNDLSLGHIDFSKQSAKQRSARAERDQLAKRTNERTERYHRDRISPKMRAQNESKIRINEIESNLESTIVNEREERQEREEKKKDRKKNKLKKIVHSVFPEEFYPLKESKRLGFQLPKLKNN